MGSIPKSMVQCNILLKIIITILIGRWSESLKILMLEVVY
jgi:hypothetical protein